MIQFRRKLQNNAAVLAPAINQYCVARTTQDLAQTRARATCNAHLSEK